eukprot:3674785-Prymnesium_polylepis.2
MYHHPSAVAVGQPVNIVQNTSLATSSTAERSRTTSPMTPVTGPAASTTTSNLRAMCRWSWSEERARAPRTALWDRVGWVGLGWSAA